MHILKAMMLVFTIMLCLALVGCSGPPSDVVEEAVKKDLNKIYGANIGTITDLDITNEFTKVHNEEEIFVYEYEAEVEHEKNLMALMGKDEFGTYTGRVGLVKRGDKWYSLK